MRNGDPWMVVTPAHAVGPFTFSLGEYSLKIFEDKHWPLVATILNFDMAALMMMAAANG
jgi:hypothetical protein